MYRLAVYKELSRSHTAPVPASKGFMAYLIYMIHDYLVYF